MVDFAGGAEIYHFDVIFIFYQQVDFLEISVEYTVLMQEINPIENLQARLYPWMQQPPTRACLIKVFLIVFHEYTLWILLLNFLLTLEGW
jgi:hypothetical protein